MWQRDDSKYSLRSTLPPVPEEEDEQTADPFFIFPLCVGTTIESTLNYLGIIGPPERRSSIFTRLRPEASFESAVNRRSWHGESIPRNNAVPGMLRSPEGYESDDEVGCTQFDKSSSIRSSEAASFNFKWFCIYFLIAAIVFGICYCGFVQHNDVINNCKPCKCDCDEMRKIYRVFTLTNDKLFQCTFEEIKVNHSHSLAARQH